MKLLKKVFFRVLIASFLVTAPSAVCAQMFETPVDFNDWLMRYYENPEPDKLARTMLYYTGEGLYKQVNGRALMVVFYATAINNDQEGMESVYNFMTESGTEDARVFAFNVLWQINTKESKEYLKKMEENWKDPQLIKAVELAKQRHPPHPMKDPIVGAGNIDMLWAMFFASGAEEPVIRIIETMALVEAKKLETMIIGGAAQWSLKSNAKAHTRVMDICKKQLRRQKGYVRDQLEEITRSYE